MQILLISKAVNGCGNLHTINRIRTGLEKILPNHQLELLQLTSSTPHNETKFEHEIIIGLNISRCAFIHDYLNNKSKLILICGGSDVNNDCNNSRMFKEMSKIVRRSCAVVFFCPSLKNAFMRYWPDYSGIMRNICQSLDADIPNAIKLKELTVQEISCRLSTPLLRFMLFVGRLRPIKDPEFILDPFLEWLSEQENPSDFQLLYIGSIEEETDEIHAFIQRINRYPSVFWLESLPQIQVHSLMTAAECLINSSVSEGQPLTVMEAMAIGCPLIVRSIPGNLDLITDGITGLVFDTKSKLKQCLSLLTSDRLLRQKIVHNSKTKIQLPNFSLQNEAVSFRNLIDEVVKSSV